MEVRYRDRATGKEETERVFGERALRFLYSGSILSRLLRGAARRPFTSHLYGALQRSGRSRRTIDEFVRTLGIDVAEAERPLADYESLDAFFTRRLKPTCRPIDPEPRHLASPADARVLVFPRLSGELLPVKGASVPLTELASEGARYTGGAAMILRLAPADYHRFHFPDTGVATSWREIPGPLDSVHPIALTAGAPSFLNKRHVSELETRSFGTLLLIEVGALCVGTIVQTYRPGPVERGAEKGYFCFGGSTIVLVASAGAIRFDEDLVAASSAGMETLVRMGTRIACSP
ncbi:MAG TPA: phosphatidylserine decarboxylase [Planctomycetota bacterium]|nr:phosphatidylserine decarboxylase [Planctomycetota bacterium]